MAIDYNRLHKGLSGVARPGISDDRDNPTMAERRLLNIIEVQKEEISRLRRLLGLDLMR